MTLRYDFVLIDLYSQRKAVNRYIAEWPKKDVLSWIGRYGLITTHEAASLEVYVFNPTCCFGLWTVFCFTEDMDDLGFQTEGRLYMDVNIRRINDG